MKRRSEFLRVRDSGLSKSGRLLRLSVLLDEELPTSRFGFIVPKRVGNAVIRNRVKRRLRSIVRAEGAGLEDKRRYVTIAHPAAAQASFEHLEKEWRWLARKLEVVESNAPG